MTTPIHSQLLEREPFPAAANRQAAEPPAMPGEHVAPGFVPYQELLRHLWANPSCVNALCGHSPALDWDALLDHGPEPADPAEHAHWSAGREVLERVKPALKQREEHLARYLKQRDYQAGLAVLRSRDPLYEGTMRIMDHYVSKLPEVLRRLVMPALAREFGLFSEFYRVAREAAWLVNSHARARRSTARSRAAAPA
ncbi:hypothetical protein, partial [Fundidesulfovibrio magnetotacticus]|uniref:hypothetical protein n=1 Tax=Fundidesulfovibrio magnetotacticus TaxID=2730080 RepID=UPI0015640A32